MKNVILLFLSALLSLQTAFGQIKSKVDERFELIGVMFALAGVPEYGQIGVSSYKEDIIDKFISFENSDEIEYIRILNQEHAIGYNAVATTTDMLEFHKGIIRLKPCYEISKISEMDSRWNEFLFAEYLKVVNSFYKNSNFHDFYTNHSELYNTMETQMDQLLNDIKFEWFESFFGKPFDRQIQVMISLTNSSSNYAIPTGVILGIITDANGIPRLSDIKKYSLIHEICHHYTNPLFERLWPKIKNEAEEIYPTVEQQMRQYAYSGARTVFAEWLNNLCTLMYYKEYEPADYRGNIGMNMSRGFIWMERSVDFMENFYTDRERYPTINEFMSQIVNFVKFTTGNLGFIVREYEARHPYILSIYPAINSEIDDVHEIIVTFSEPMLGSTGFIPQIDDSDVKPMFFLKDLKWSDDRRQIKFIIEPDEAQENGFYGFGLDPKWFLSLRYFSLDPNSQNLIFKISKK